MRTARISLIALTLVAALLGGSCSRPPVLNSETAPTNLKIVAKADRGYSLTARDFYQALYRSHAQNLGGYMKESEIQWLLDSLVLDTLTGFAADDLDLSSHYSENWMYKTRYNSALLGKWFDVNVASLTKVDSLEVLEFHKTHPRMFEIPEQAHVLHIMTAAVAFLNGHDSAKYRALTQDELETEVHNYALHLRRLVDSGMAFEEVATRYSQDVSTKNSGGEMGWVERNVYRPPFDSVVFSLKPGEVSAPYKDQDGWHILKVVDRLDAGPTPIDRAEFYDQARQSAINDRQAKLLRTLTDSLSKGLDLQINPAILDADVFLTPDSVWCAVVNQTDTIDVQMMKTMDDAVRSQYRVANTNAEQKKAILGILAQRAVLLQDARRNKLDTLPEVLSEKHKLHHATGKGYLIERWWDRKWRPSDSAIAAYYGANPREFIVEKPLTVQQIVAKDSATALFLRDQAMSGVDFMELAREYYPGEPSVREAAADLGKIGPRDVDSSFYMAAFGLPVGEVSMPVKSRYGYHIIKLIKREQTRSLADAKAMISQKLEAAHRQDDMLRLKNELAARFHAQFPTKIKSIFLEPYAYRKF